MNKDACIAELKSALPAKACVQDESRLAPYLTEWRDRWTGQTPLLLLPDSTEQVSGIVKICARHKTPITVQGGNTGLVGGQIPKGEILLSTQRLNKVRSVNKADLCLTIEAGARLLEAQAAAEAAGLKFPLSLASEGSCTIGGNLSTNAGGVHVVKYGTAKDLCFGVEAVLADGQIFNGLTSLRKDNTGYDLSRLLLGAEGTLGIITAASLKLFPRPAQTVRVMASLSSPQHAQSLLELCRIGTHLSMFELMPRLGIDLVTNHQPSLRDPFAAPAPWYVLLDWEFDTETGADGFAETVLQRAFEDGLILDAVIAKSGAQAAELLALRENLSAAQKQLGGSIKHDISLPINKVADFIETANAALDTLVPGCRPLPFGHFGDGNLHYNIGRPETVSGAEFAATEAKMNAVVYDIVCDMSGSISAEHGIGILKKDELARRADPAKLSMLRAIKTALDPNGILNPRTMIEL